MGRTARTSEANIETPMEGGHNARLLWIIDLGEQPSWNFEGVTQPAAWKYEFVYELVNHKMSDGRPFVVSESMNNKVWEGEGSKASTLVMRAKSLMGPDYKKGLEDVTLLLGRPCVVTVIHNKKGYANVAGQGGVGSLPFGTEIPPLHNEPHFFDMEDSNIDLNFYDRLRKLTKDKLQSALNYPESNLARLLAEEGEY